MDKSSSSLSEPLIVPQKMSRPKKELDVSTSKGKMSDQIQVHRLMSFLLGSMTGIILQIVSVLLFTKLVLHAHRQHSLLANGDDSEPTKDTNPHDYVMSLSPSPWFHFAVWTIYHLSLGVYLVVWFTMMVLAISKVGWKCLSQWVICVPQHVPRRTCFLRTFFFINGFVQGSLMPWIFLELYIGNPAFDVYWMPTTHLLVFFAVVFIYDWMRDSSTPRQPSSNDEGDDDEYEMYYEDDEDDDDDDDANYLV